MPRQNILKLVEAVFLLLVVGCNCNSGPKSNYDPPTTQSGSVPLDLGQTAVLPWVANTTPALGPTETTTSDADRSEDAF